MASDADDPHIRSSSSPAMDYPSGMPFHMYPYSPNHIVPQPLRAKRRQVKNACVNCQRACKKCDDARPCLRCVKYGIGEECVDSQRKERKRGVKRGPYKKRDRADSNPIDQTDINPQDKLHGSAAHSLPQAPNHSSPSSTGAYMGPLHYAPSYYSAYPPPPKPSEAPVPYYAPIFVGSSMAETTSGESTVGTGQTNASHFYPMYMYPQPFPAGDVQMRSMSMSQTYSSYSDSQSEPKLSCMGSHDKI